MTKLKRLFAILIVVLPTLLWPAALHAQPAGPDSSDCLYPSPTDRFGVTVFSNQTIGQYDVSPLAAGKYLDWHANASPLQPNGMRYYQMVHTGETEIYPRGEALRKIALANSGATWIIGNEADVLWQDNVTPEAYARDFHEIYTTVTSVDPTAKFVSNGIGQVSVCVLPGSIGCGIPIAACTVWTFRWTSGMSIPISPMKCISSGDRKSLLASPMLSAIR